MPGCRYHRAGDLPARHRDLQADVEASAAASEAQDGDAMPLALLRTTLVREYLQKDQACL